MNHRNLHKIVLFGVVALCVAFVYSCKSAPQAAEVAASSGAGGFLGWFLGPWGAAIGAAICAVLAWIHVKESIVDAVTEKLAVKIDKLATLADDTKQRVDAIKNAPPSRIHEVVADGGSWSTLPWIDIGIGLVLVALLIHFRKPILAWLRERNEGSK